MPYPRTPEEWEEWQRTNSLDSQDRETLYFGEEEPDTDPGGTLETVHPGGHGGEGTPISPPDSPTDVPGQEPVPGDGQEFTRDSGQWGELPGFEFQPPEGFDRGEYQTPPPPTPPPAPPPPPDLHQAAQIRGLPQLPQWQDPNAPADAPDFMNVLDDYLRPGTEFQRPDGPGAARDFEGIVENVPGYETPENAFLGEGLYPELEQYARDRMDNPNRFDSEIAAQTRADGALQRAHEQGVQTRGIEEWAASRGLVASSLEGELMVQLADAMNRAQSQEELELLYRIADAEAADREAAGRFGLDVSEQGRRLGQTRIDEAMGRADLDGRRADRQLTAAELAERAEMGRAQFGLDVERSAADAGHREAGLALSAAEMEESSNRFRAQFDLQVQQSGFDAAFRNVELEQRQNIRQAELNLQAAVQGDQSAMDRLRHQLDVMRAMDSAILSREELQLQSDRIDQRTWEIQGEWEMRGEQWDAEHARWQAEIEDRRRMYDRDDDFRHDELDQRDRHQRDAIDAQWS